MILLPYAVYRNRITEEDRREAIGESLKQCVIILLLITLFSYIYIFLFLPNIIPKPEIFIFGFLIFLIGSHLREFCRGICIGDSRFLIILLIDVVISGTLFLILLSLFLSTEVTVSTIFIAVASSCVCGILVWFRIYWPQITLLSGLRRNAVAENWRLGRWVLASNAPLMINMYINIWLVGALLGPREAGIIAACNALVMVVNPAITAFHNVILPHASQLGAEKGGLRLYRLIFKSAGLLGLALGAFCVLVWIFGGWLIVKIYGPSFNGQDSIVLLLAIVVLARSVSMPSQIGLLVAESAKSLLLVNLLAFFTNLIMSLILIPKVGIIGSATAAVFSEVIATAVRWLAFHRIMHSKNLARGGL